MDLLLNATPATPRRVGRKKINFERPTVRLPAGTLERIDVVLRKGERPTDFFRIAFEHELRRREAVRERRARKDRAQN